MPVLLLTIVRYLGFGGCVAVAMFVFYEGLPLGPIRYIPWVGPALEQLVDGRVDREYRRGEEAERLVWRERQRDEGDGYRSRDMAAETQGMLDHDGPPVRGWLAGVTR